MHHSTISTPIRFPWNLPSKWTCLPFNHRASNSGNILLDWIHSKKHLLKFDMHQMKLNKRNEEVTVEFHGSIVASQCASRIRLTIQLG
jgi:hypothetical protein